MLIDKVLIQNIKEIYKITDEQFLSQCEEEVYQLFQKHYNFIRNKNVLFLCDPTFSLKYGAVLHHFLGSNNYVYVDKDATHFRAAETQALIPYKNHDIHFDYLITTCAVYDMQGHFLVDKMTHKKIQQINAKNIIVLTLNMQLVDTIIDPTCDCGTIITNQKIIPYCKR